LIKGEDGIYLNVIFSKSVEVKECKDVIGVDVYESYVTIVTNQSFIVSKTREIRTAYFVKRCKIQEKIKCKRWK